MSYTKHGTDTYDFQFESGAADAIASATGIVPKKLTINRQPEFTAEAQDTEGLTESFVVGDDMMEVTLEGYLVNESTFMSCTEFDYDGLTCIVIGRDLPREIRKFAEVSITAKAWPELAV